MKTFLFYDIETSGLHPAFDQVLTFACIRTDLELREIERQTITIRLRKDIVPSPNAFLTHRLTFLELERGISEYEAALKIHRIVNKPGTISIGYNSLGFDDEFLRFLFYRNLLDPYTHQYADGCSRMDALPITVVFRVFNPQSLKWPEIDGKSSLKLEWISRENRFVTSGKAHEALNDVEAVIELCKIFIGYTDIWNYTLDFFNKTRDEVRINSINSPLGIHLHNEKYPVCLMASASFGPAVNYLAPVVQLGGSKAYKNQKLWLRLDSDDIPGLAEKPDIPKTWVIRKRPADELIVLPPLDRFWMKLPNTSKRSFEKNMKKIGDSPEKFIELAAYHCEYKYPFIPDMDPDAALYQSGFFSAREKKEIGLFHSARNNQKIDALQKITSTRISTLAGRILARSFEDAAGGHETEEYHLHLSRLRSSLEKDRIIGYKEDMKFNRQQGLAKLTEVSRELLNPDQDQKQMLDWLKAYIERI